MHLVSACRHVAGVRKCWCWRVCECRLVCLSVVVASTTAFCQAVQAICSVMGGLIIGVLWLEGNCCLLYCMHASHTVTDKICRGTCCRNSDALSGLPTQAATALDICSTSPGVFDWQHCTCSAAVSRISRIPESCPGKLNKYGDVFFLGEATKFLKPVWMYKVVQGHHWL